MIAGLPAAISQIRVAASETTRALASIVNPFNQTLTLLRKVSFPYKVWMGSIATGSAAAGSWTNLRIDNNSAGPCYYQNTAQTSLIDVHVNVLSGTASPCKFQLFNVAANKVIWSSPVIQVNQQGLFGPYQLNSIVLLPYVAYVLQVSFTTGTGSVSAYGSIKVAE